MNINELFIQKSDKTCNVCIDNETNEIVFNETTNQTISDIADICNVSKEIAKDYVLSQKNNLIAYKNSCNLPQFSYYTKPIMNLIPTANINLLQLYYVIKDNKNIKQKTFEFRNIIDKTAKAKYKNTKFDYVCFSGIFEPLKRNSNGCLQLSGYMVIDIDGKDNPQITDLQKVKNTLIADLNLDIQLMFVSPSGDGLKIVLFYDINENTIIEIFEIMRLYFLQSYGIKIDKSGKNIDRACYICHDNDVYINQKIFETC